MFKRVLPLFLLGGLFSLSCFGAKPVTLLQLEEIPQLMATELEEVYKRKVADLVLKQYTAELTKLGNGVNVKLKVEVDGAPKAHSFHCHWHADKEWDCHLQE